MYHPPPMNQFVEMIVEQKLSMELNKSKTSISAMWDFFSFLFLIYYLNCNNCKLLCLPDNMILTVKLVKTDVLNLHITAVSQKATFST